MIEKLVEIDKEIFLFLNSINHHWADTLMIALSSYTLWAIVFAVVGFLIYRSQKKYKIAAVLFYIGSVVTSTLLTNGLKLIVQRPRPIHEEAWHGLIHNIEKYSSAYSFFSSHAATTFCIAMFVSLCFRSQRLYRVVAFLWAFGVSYSRIYVGKHYPGDVLVGILFGTFIGYVGHKMLMKYIGKKENLLA